MPLTVLNVSYPLASVAGNTAGGAEQILSILDEAIVNAGHHSAVIAPEGSTCAGLLLPIQLQRSPLDELARRLAHEQCRAAIASALERYTVDVVHMHGIDFVEYLPPAGVPVVVTLHLPLSWYKPEIFVLRRPDTYLVCVSESQKRLGAPSSSNCRVIGNGVRLDRYKPYAEKGNYVVALGRICPEKGFHVAVKAANAARIPLVLAGQVFGYKAHVDYFETVLRPRLVPPHRFIGPVGGNQKAELLARARCLVVPSLVAETSCLVAMEALASGTPVVAFRRGAMSEVVEHGCTGFLVDTPQQLADAIVAAGELDPAACRLRAERYFSADKMITAYLSLYEEITSAARGAVPAYQEAA